MTGREYQEGESANDLKLCGSCQHLGSEHLDFDFGSCCVGGPNDDCDCEQFQETDD